MRTLCVGVSLLWDVQCHGASSSADPNTNLRPPAQLMLMCVLEKRCQVLFPLFFSFFHKKNCLFSLLSLSTLFPLRWLSFFHCALLLSPFHPPSVMGAPGLHHCRLIHSFHRANQKPSTCPWLYSSPAYKRGRMTNKWSGPLCPRRKLKGSAKRRRGKGNILRVCLTVCVWDGRWSWN